MSPLVLLQSKSVRFSYSNWTALNICNYLILSNVVRLSYLFLLSLEEKKGKEDKYKIINKVFKTNWPSGQTDAIGFIFPCIFPLVVL